MVYIFNIFQFVKILIIFQTNSFKIHSFFSLTFVEALLHNIAWDT